MGAFLRQALPFRITGRLFLFVAGAHPLRTVLVAIDGEGPWPALRPSFQAASARSPWGMMHGALTATRHLHPAPATRHRPTPTRTTTTSDPARSRSHLHPGHSIDT